METGYVEQTRVERRSVRGRLPRELAAPALLIFLLGLWVLFVPLVGPYFDFGFGTDNTWSFSEQHWILSLAPGILAALAGLLMLVPNRGASSFWAFLATAAGAWLVVGPSLYPVWSSADVQPTGDSEGMNALLWIGYFYGPGALLLYLSGMAHGLLARPRRGEPVVAEPMAEPMEDAETEVEQRRVVVG